MMTKLSAILAHGRLWEKGGNSRVYIDAAELLAECGYEIACYKTGNIKSARNAAGETISNSAAKRLIAALYGVYYDNVAKEFSKDVEGLLGIEIVDDVNTAEEIETAKEAAAAAASKWHKVPVNFQNIKTETEKAFLIAMPHSSDYDGFKFWYPKKLVREGSHAYEVTLSVSDDMEITLRRTSEKTRQVLEEKVVGAEELLAAFGQTVKHDPASIESAPHTEEKLTTAAELLSALAESDTNEYEHESERIQAWMDALCDGEALTSLGCKDEDQEAVEEAYDTLREQLDRAETIEKVGAENLLQPSEIEFLFKIEGELNAPSPEMLYIKATMYVLLGEKSDEVSDQEMIDGTAWSVDATIDGRRCHAETGYTDHRLPENPCVEQVVKLIEDLNLEAARNTKIEEEE